MGLLARDVREMEGEIRVGAVKGRSVIGSLTTVMRTTEETREP